MNRTGIATAIFVLVSSAAFAEVTPTGQTITPLAAKGSQFQALDPAIAADPAYRAGQPSALAVSPDGRTLLVLTSGFNRTYGTDGAFIPALSTEFVFLFDISSGVPVKIQSLAVPNAFLGIAWAPAGDRFFVGGGVDDDVLEFLRGPKGFTPARTFALGHKAGLGLAVKPETAGLAVSPDGRRLLIANFQNDSVSMIDLVTGARVEADLRPGAIDRANHGKAGGTFPRAVAWTADDKAFVASQRDRQVIALNVGPQSVKVEARITVGGQPTALASGPADRLYAAVDNTDSVAVIDSRVNRLVGEVPISGATGPRLAGLGGAGANSVALSPDGKTLYVGNGAENAVAVVRLGTKGEPPHVEGLIPTAWYPTAVVVSADGANLFIANGKNNTGPVPRACRDNLETTPASQDACQAANQYVWQKEKGGLLSLPVPSASDLARLTAQVAANNHWGDRLSAGEQAKMDFLKAHIRHVIYVVKENRTYDQILGDLEVGNGDPALAIFGRSLTPNQHALARRFVDLDAFFDSGESSNTGWNWTVAGRTNDYTEREAPVNYADRGLQYDQEGDNRNLNMGLATAAERRARNPLAPDDPDVLPGAVDVAAPDGPEGSTSEGYLWDQALKAGLTVRNWGFYGDLILYSPKAGAARTPLERDPFKAGIKVFVPAKASLMDRTDLYYRGFDQAFPDFWRFKEWEREFDGFVAGKLAPSLMLVRLPHDHTGAFGAGLDGVDTVETEIADNDYALGLLIEKVAQSPFAADTLIFVVEDDAQDGPDHVDAHRSVAFVAGPYVRQGAVVSHRYQTVDLVRTIEAVLGIPPMGLTDALATPMADVFDPTVTAWSFEAAPSQALRATALPLAGRFAATSVCPGRSGAWWAAVMAGQDFSEEDRLDTPRFNLALWRGMKGSAPYPVDRNGRDLRKDRATLTSDGNGCGLSK